ncbi:hypothetical protein [Adhaeribacter aquaticus]|nr:hypothetical protein [Adhaeribacter aquaticus]
MKKRLERHKKQEKQARVLVYRRKPTTFVQPNQQEAETERLHNQQE